MEITKVEKYYDKILEMFPELTLSELDKIIKTGMGNFYMYNLKGGDVQLKMQGFMMYCGRYLAEGKHFFYNKEKRRIRFHIQYRRDKPKFDGYYYFGLSEEEYQLYLQENCNKFQHRKHKIFHRITLYKILEEALLNVTKKYIFRYKLELEVGFKFFKEYLKTAYAELILIRHGWLNAKPVNEKVGETIRRMNQINKAWCVKYKKMR